MTLKTGEMSAECSALPLLELKYIKTESSYFNLSYVTVFSISNQINAALVSIRNPKLLNGSVTLEEREFYYDFMLS